MSIKTQKNKTIKADNTIQEDRGLLPLSSDIVFKRVFSREENKDLLKSILEAILKIKIREIEILNPNIERDYTDSKAGALDIKARIDQDAVIDIEMQVANVYNYVNRNTFYLVKTSSEEMKIGQKYSDFRKTISISILCENIIKRNSYLNIAHMKFEPYDDETYINMGYSDEQQIATDKLEMIFLEIPKFVAKKPDTENLLNQWLWMIAGEMERVEMANKKYDSIEKAMDVIKEMSANREEWEIYDSREKAIINYNSDMHAAREAGLAEGKKAGLAEGKKAGLAEGRKSGLAESKKEIAKKLLNLGMEIDKISEITELSKEEILKLKS